jgi:hypothetical protein
MMIPPLGIDFDGVIRVPVTTMLVSSALSCAPFAPPD